MYEKGQKDAELGRLDEHYNEMDAKSRRDYEEGYCNKAWEMGADDSKYNHGRRDLGHFKLKEAKVMYLDGYQADEDGLE